MEKIKSIGLVICMLMVLMAYMKQMIPYGKTTLLMNSIVSVFILLSIIDGFKTVDFGSFKSFFERSYSHNAEVWDNAAVMIEDGLRDEFQRYLKNERIVAEVIDVTVERSSDEFEIKKVIVSGSDAETARNLLSGRYQIGIAYIEVKNE